MKSIKAMITAGCALVLAFFGTAAAAHPHVFVDGRIDFAFSADKTLQGIEVTWLYDPFETLYVLSQLDIDPGSTWELTEDQRQALIAYESDWADSFNGAARLSAGKTQLPLAPPTDFDVRLVGNQLEVRFTRALAAPQPVTPDPIEVTFYEETYFFAFKIADVPALLGPSESCAAKVEPFDADTQMASLQSTLLKLGREETPEDLDVGRLFTDRIFLSCV